MRQPPPLCFAETYTNAAVRSRPTWMLKAKPQPQDAAPKLVAIFHLSPHHCCLSGHISVCLPPRIIFRGVSKFPLFSPGYDLLGFVDGTHPCPEQTITVNGVTTVNPAHHPWVRQDQLILNAILGSLSPPLIPFIATARTSRDAWSTLALTYGQPTRGLITHLKTQLNNPLKGSQTIIEFMHNIKTKVDALAMLNSPVDIEDLFIKILNGLDADYTELAECYSSPRDGDLL
ncbi:hypothetical protein F0562_023922 [Nyssa sinensis]|uniref:Retrotransposon Copia-like N-terminal domain-containing protein n=1 Tax=Nyssa sinensis TaxID=561372 RepID=A0A5J5BKJ5_9ASTE|nr:hypothetical protein F0562_023922 [Nyssa sinensis]